MRLSRPGVRQHRGEADEPQDRHALSGRGTRSHAPVVARSQAPAGRHDTTSYATAVARLTHRLRLSGYSDIRCGWTGYLNTGPIVVTCTGTRSSDSGSTSLWSIGITIQGARADDHNPAIGEA